MTNDNRVPAGVPTGGEFAVGAKVENEDLMTDEQFAQSLAKEVGGEIIDTGGGCMAIEIALPYVPVEGGDVPHMLITDGDYGLPTARAALIGAYDQNGDDWDEIELMEGPLTVADIKASVAEKLQAWNAYMSPAPARPEFVSEHPYLLLEGARRAVALADELSESKVKHPFSEACTRVYFGEERWSDARLVPSKAEQRKLFLADVKAAGDALAKNGLTPTWRGHYTDFPADAGGSDLYAFKGPDGGQYWLRRGSRIGTYRLAQDDGKILPMEGRVSELLDALDEAKG